MNQSNATRLKKRSFGREFALKSLYCREIHGMMDDAMMESLARSEGLYEAPVFSRTLIRGCLEQMDRLDEVIQTVATNWRLDRMPALDRNILRLGAYELLFCPDVPPKVAINEAIELSKRYSTEDSPNFVNGVLDKVYTGFAASSRNGSGGAADTSGASRTLFERFEWMCLHAGPDARADLHVHSDASDGELSPAGVVKEAERCGVDVIALADHDSIDGLQSALEAAESSPVGVVPGVEMSAYTVGADGAREHELHILGYFFDADHPALNEQLEALRAIRVERIRKIAARLAEYGIELDAEKLISNSYSTVGRLHVALELIRMDVCRDVEEAFRTLLGSGMPAYVPKEKLTVQHTMELIHAAGGCAVLAHPGLVEGMEHGMDELLAAGLDGIEVHYPGHDHRTVAFWMNFAQDHDLVVTGGSDFHGNSGAEIVLGQKTVSIVEVQRLLERSMRYRGQGRELPVAAES